MKRTTIAALLAACIPYWALAQQAAFGATEALVRLLGFWGRDAQLTLPMQLPTLLARARVQSESATGTSPAANPGYWS